MVTRDLGAGAALGADNLRQVRIPAAGDQFVVLTDDPTHRRTAHPLRAQTLLSPDDVLSREMVQVPINVRSSPSVAAGDTVDVYAVVGSRAVLVGRHLIVMATGNPLTMLVPANDEAYWIALEANNIALFASKSDGVGVTESGSASVSEAIAGLSGSAQPGEVLGGGGGGGLPQVTPTPLPSASPPPAASPGATPRPTSP